MKRTETITGINWVSPKTYISLHITCIYAYMYMYVQIKFEFKFKNISGEASQVCGV